MIVDEIIATCSHPKIAGAALRSIGGAFLEEVGHDARARGLAPGDFVALVVRQFGAVATAADRIAVSTAVKGHDTPLLEGLRRIMKEFSSLGQRLEPTGR